MIFFFFCLKSCWLLKLWPKDQTEFFYFLNLFMVREIFSVCARTHIYFWVASISFQRPLIFTWGVLIQLVVVVSVVAVLVHTWVTDLAGVTALEDALHLSCFVAIFQRAHFSSVEILSPSSSHSTPTYSSFRPPAGVIISDVLLLTLYVQDQWLHVSWTDVFQMNMGSSLWPFHGTVGVFSLNPPIRHTMCVTQPTKMM